MLPKQGKMIFYLFCIGTLRWTPTSCQLNMYNTDGVGKGSMSQYDCLDYYVYRKQIAYQDLSDVTVDVIPYCFRPENVVEQPIASVVHPLARRLSFEEARSLNITSAELLRWSVPMETIDRYQDYVNTGDLSLNEFLYNCTPPWFGVRCQYSFGPLHGLSFTDIVPTTLNGQQLYAHAASEMIVSVPCYVLVECRRYGQKWCLDWREVCNGVIDCFDEGVDEDGCFMMEMNECKASEYRCHNGLCIADELWEADNGEAECLDRSDERNDASYTNMCHLDPEFRCEEHSCRPDGLSFPCGDGQCVRRFDPCHNGRHRLLIEWTLQQGNLTYQCWMTMVCLTQLVKEMNGTLCEVWLKSNSLNESLAACDSLFQFPIFPIYSNHVRLLYESIHLRDDLAENFTPEYVCYDRQLCEFPFTESFGDKLSCRRWRDVEIEWDLSNENSWSLMFELVEYELRTCLVSKVVAGKETKSTNPSTLYRCRNSSKSISAHRIKDGLLDCVGRDDENVSDSCSLHHRHRVRCANATICWSPLLEADTCLRSDEQSAKDIPFQSFCDGISHHFYHNSTRQWRDEEDGCNIDKLCDNMYARCDGYWACPDGRDESNCSQQMCPAGSHACVSPFNYTVFCLPGTGVNNGINDCLGATDEPYECQSGAISRKIRRNFRCLDDEHCLGASQLCDKKVNCESGEDDERFCEAHHQFTCQKNASHHRSKIEQVLCGLNEDDEKRIKYFSVVTSPIYPTSQDGFSGETNISLVKQHPILVNHTLATKNHAWFHPCHRGLTIAQWVNDTSNHSRRCLCPASYYGDRCQFQNQRVSLTLRLSSDNRHATYGIITMLLDDDTDEIITFNQFQYVAKDSCVEKFNHYLLYPTRPKNISKNYSVRVDVIEKNQMVYIGHWHFSVPFLFLPVNRMGIALKLSDYLLHAPSQCPVNCLNKAECVKYVNKAKYFCRYPVVKTNKESHADLNCHRCSFGSICIGSASSRPICVCPLSQHGARCLQSNKCPLGACKNSGQCVWNDRSISGSDYTCVCPDRYFGSSCQYKKWRLDVSLGHLSVPKHLLAYFFTVSNQSDPTRTVILRKLTLFQHTVTFHISIPFHLVIIRIDNQYYRAFLQHTPKMHTLTTIDPKQECPSVRHFFSPEVLQLVAYERIVHFHKLCYERQDLTCFIDEVYFCLCTNDHHANCVTLNQRENFDCASPGYCLNEGKCYQDHPSCPSTKICICSGCFFGRQCQLYAKGLGSTLDEILGYEFEREHSLFKQPFSVQISAAITTLIVIVGIISGVLSIITFSQVKPREVGCGMYLLASSVTSLMTVILFAIKFWLLFLSYRGVFNTALVRLINCRCVEVLLKLFLYMDNWVNACVSIERTYSISQGLHFDKRRSRHRARIAIFLLIIVNVAVLVPQTIFLHVFEDQLEERTWCVITYKGWLNTYNLTMIFIHYFVPLCVQFYSTAYIIVITARQRSAAQTELSFWIHLTKKIRKYKQLLIGPIVIIILTLPHLIVAIILDCNKSSRRLWFHLFGYFMSFVPAAFVFLIFVIPSPLYRKQLRQCFSRIQRRIKARRAN